MAPFGPKSAALVGTTVTAATLARRARQRKLAPSELQSDPPVAPKQGQGICAGLRVVDMAGIVAGPTVTRCLADWGAEVIKIEAPEGDLIRGMMNVERDQKPLPRDINATFEFFNLGKAGVQLDFSKPSELAWLKDLLASADIFVTNVRVQALKKAGLMFSDLAEQCPRLIYAHLTGWGSQGIDAERAGVDAGPFWSASGLAGTITGPETCGHYPVGFGDIVTGMSLLGGLLCALLERDGEKGSGRGQYVDASLLRAGLWCAAPGILAASDVAGQTREGDTVTDYNRKPPMHGSRAIGEEAWWAVPFPCESKKECIWFDVPADSSVVDSQLREAVSKALHLEGDTKELIGLPEQAFRERVSATLSTRVRSEAATALQNEGVACIARHVTFVEAGAALFDENSSHMARLYRAAGCVDELEASLGIKDFAGVPRVPISFSSVVHGPRSPAFRKGQHTRAVLARGWSTPLVASEVVGQNNPIGLENGRSTGPLHGFTIVELSGAEDLSASAACCQLAEHGASVLKVKVCGSTLPPVLLQHYDRLKRIVATDQDLESTLFSLLKNADVFITNMPMSQLHAQGVSLEAIKSSFPELVSVVLSPWGRSNDAEVAAKAAGFGPQSGALAALWAASGLSATFMSVADSPPPIPTLQLSELCASAFGFAAVGAALLGKRRCQLKGEIVDVPYLGVGMFLSAFIQVFYRHDEARAITFDGFADSKLDARKTSIMSTHSSSDGQYFMMYDMRPTAIFMKRKVAGMGVFTLVRAIAQAVQAALTDPNKSLSGFIPLRSAIRQINNAFDEHYEKLTWAEISAGLLKSGIWHNRVAMPYQMAGYPTACTGPAASISRDDVGMVVHSPVFLSRKVDTEKQPLLRSKL